MFPVVGDTVSVVSTVRLEICVASKDDFLDNRFNVRSTNDE